ncbi:MAG: 4-hydroxy-3-methylbut-2-enyl diphosphate reductase [Lachnospiraceae bacterium]|nr:4-hydroxy-3-methylbut-2-enyl diphosphate reductase [Lachnospiraceae bacterium]
MKVILAESAGFCFGVKRALDIAEETIKNEKGPIYTYGPIIHNEQVVRDLEEKGVMVMPEESDPADYERGIVIIRSHGVSREVTEKIEAAGHRVVDATCPFVGKIHRIVEEKTEAGEKVIIIGDETHPEVRGIIGWAKSDDVVAVKNEEEARKYSANSGDTVNIVAQTTFNLRKFEDLVEIIKQKGYHIVVLNTICNATEERQNEALRLSSIVDAMIVIGGANSSNSRKLYEICRNNCKAAYFIQCNDDLDRSRFFDCKTIGITAGASTPYYIIQEVLQGWQR